MKATVKVEGLQAVDQALADLIASTSSATGRNVMRRGLVEAAQPMADKARSLVPVKTGKLRDSIIVSSRLARRIGSAEFSAAMHAGLGKAAATAALRDATREHKGSYGQVVVYVGAGQLPHAHLVEFGTVHSAPHPYMRPAWEATREGVLDGLTITLGAHIEKAAVRARRRAAGKNRFDTRASKG